MIVSSIWTVKVYLAYLIGTATGTMKKGRSKSAACMRAYQVQVDATNKDLCEPHTKVPSFTSAQYQYRRGGNCYNATPTIDIYHVLLCVSHKTPQFQHNLTTSTKLHRATLLYRNCIPTTATICTEHTTSLTTYTSSSTCGDNWSIEQHLRYPHKRAHPNMFLKHDYFFPPNRSVFITSIDAHHAGCQSSAREMWRCGRKGYWNWVDCIVWGLEHIMNWENSHE
jgi:hypothetical protein